MADETLKLVLVGEDRSASKALKGVGDEADKVGKRTTAAGSVMKGALGAAVFAQAAGAVLDFGKDSVLAYRDAAASQRKLEDAYKRFPSVQDVPISKMREMNQAIQDKTGADADDIASSQSVLARYKLTGSQISAMTPLLVDYAKRTGKDLPAAGTTLGKALAGNGRAMKELGIKFKDTGDPAKNFEQVMKGLKEKVGGFAESEATTLDGKLSILQTKFGDVQEAVGEKLLPALTGIADAGMAVIKWAEKNQSVLGPLAIGLAAGAVAYGVLTVAMGLHAAFTAASAAASGGLTVAQWALNAALNANPIGLIVLALAALVAGLVWAYRNVKPFRDACNSAFKAIGAVATWLWNNALAPALRGIVTGFAWVVDGIANMLGALGQVPGFEWAKTAAANMRGMARDARAAAAGIKNIPDREPKLSLKDSASSKIKEIDAKIKALKGKVVEARAKGDTKAVENLQKKINALKSKLVTIRANVVKTGINAIKVYTSGSGTVRFSAAARGGIFRAMAEGGIAGGSPRIYSRADGVMFNEPETQGESYIPLANDSRRPRAVSVWRETGRILGQMAGGGITGRPSMGGGDVYNISVQGDTDPLAAARRIEQALSRLKESRGRRPLAFS